MPFLSERQRLLGDLETLILLSNYKDDDEQEEELLELYAHVLASRYLGERQVIRRPPITFLESFSKLSDGEFRLMFRTSKAGLFALLDKIQDNAIFSNNSPCPQTHPSWQLAIALTRFGVHGTNASVSKTQAIFGVSNGTVTTFTNRVIQVLWDIQSEWLEYGLTLREGGVLGRL
ncbi:MAG: hypothetical protein JOS17DRAFT_692389 [Linnemannia elongata]|nr:MAG: hypothetical protein JOS17DRAFT_692389 [Linnemannia elongata]